MSTNILLSDVIKNDTRSFHDIKENVQLLVNSIHSKEKITDIEKYLNTLLNPLIPDVIFDPPLFSFETTLLFEAIKSENSNFVNYLLDSGANVNFQSLLIQLKTPLHFACFIGNIEIIKILVKYKADPFLKDKNNNLCIDVFSNNVSMETKKQISMLLFGEFVTDDNEDRESLFNLVQDPSKFKELEDLVSHIDLSYYIDDLYPIDNDQVTLLYLAVKNKNTKAVNLLLQYNADLNIQSTNKNNTPLHIACYNGYFDIIDLLLNGNKKGLQPIPNKINKLGETYTSKFSSKLSKKDIDLVKLRFWMKIEEFYSILSDSYKYSKYGYKISQFCQIFSSLVNIKIFKNHTETPLQVSYLSNNIKAAKDLFRYNAKIDENLFIEACKDDNIDFIKLFLEYISSSFLKTLNLSQYSNTVKDIIEKYIQDEYISSLSLKDALYYIIKNKKQLDILKDYISQHSMSINDLCDYDNEKITLLYLASKYDNKDAVELLLENDADPNRCNPNGNIPLHIATFLGYSDIVEILIQHNSDIDYTNKLNEKPDSKFDDNVSQSKKNIINICFKKKRDLLAFQFKEEIKDYLQSIKNRDINPIHKNAKNFWDSIKNSSLPHPSEKNIITILSDVAKNYCKDYYLKTSSNIHIEDNPVLKYFLLKTSDNCSKQLSLLIAENLKDIISIDIPLVFSDEYYKLIDDIAKKNLTLFKNFFEDNFVKKPYFSLVSSIQNKLALLISQTSTVNPIIRCKNISDFIEKESCKKIIDSLDIISCICRSFIKIECIPYLQDNYRQSKSILPRSKLVKACNDKKINTIQNTISYCSSLGNSFLQKFRDTIEIPEILKQIEKLLNNNSLSLSAKLFKIDNVVLSSFINFVKNQLKNYTKMNLKDEDKTSTSIIYINDIVEEYLLGNIKKEYNKPDKYLNEKTLELTIPIGMKNIINALTNSNNINKFIENQTKSVKSSSYDSNAFNMFKDNIKIIKPDTNIQINELVTILRNIFLHTTWSQMPAYSKVRSIKNAIPKNDVILIESETGSGKSTVIPQYLSHITNRKVIVTQPRREPVRSIGKFVQKQFGENYVGYQVGGSKNPKPRANLQYFTDALYLGKLISEKNYSLNNQIIMIDEVHERSATMDMLFLILLYKQIEYRKANKDFNICLASATVDIQFFKDTCHDFKASFLHCSLRVNTRFPVTDYFPKNGLLKWPIPSSNPPDRPTIASRDAFDIAKSNANARILVFLPTITEILDAESKFKVLSANSISCASIFAKAVNVSSKIQNSRVIFSNNIAETSLTIPKLTHVLDFNLCIIAEIDSIRNTSELITDICTISSYKQRRGRLGRTQPGNYIPYYVDPNKFKQGITKPLKAKQKSGFEIISSDQLTRYEIRLNYYLNLSLFKNNNKYKTLGKGIPPRIISNFPKTDILSSIPSKHLHLKIGAFLNMTSSLTKSFMYAFENHTCPTAIMWLSAILESREPPVPHGSTLPSIFTKSLGKCGDHGLLLEVLTSYFDALQQNPNLKAKQWCLSNGNINPLFLDIVEERISIVRNILSTVGIVLNDTPSSWKISDLQEALTNGYWRNCLKRVDHNLKSHDLIAPYRTIDSTQQLSVKLSKASNFVKSTATMPKYVIYLTMESKKTISWVNFITEVPENIIDKFSKHETVVQSIGLFYYQYNLVLPWIQNNSSKIYKLIIKQKGQTPQNVFSKYFQERNAKSLNNMYCEVAFKGTRIEVGKLMDEFAEEIVKQVAANNTNIAPNSNFNKFNAFGKQPATINDLIKIDPALAQRLKAAVLPRSKADLTSALHSGNRQTIGLALINILKNDFKCSMKGGIIRDIVVRNLNTFADIDMNAMASLKQSTFMSQISNMCNAMYRDYNYKVQYSNTRVGINGLANGIIVLMDHTNNIEFEIVAPWNTPFYSPNCMDMSVNNLIIGPNSNDIEQIVAIGMSCEEIVKQLLQNPPQATPIYDIKWINGSGSKSGEGYNKQKWVIAQSSTPRGTAIMQKRLDKMRKKGFWLVEGAHLSKNGLVLYHATHASAAQIILQTQTFKPGSAGLLGPGIYMSRDLRLCKNFGTHVLSANVNPGNVVVVKGFVGSSWHAPGVDTAFLPAKNSPRNLEEWCMLTSKGISNIKQYMP